MFVKTARDALVREGKDRGGVVAFGPIDYFCYGSGGRPIPEWLGLVDKVIVPNGKCDVGLREMFPAATFHVIPHQWDARLDEMAEHDAFRPGYIGRRFNFPVSASIPQVNEPEQMLLCAPWFNCHVQIREPGGLDWTWKPATKVATAAAVGAPIITTADPSSKELLGPEYPLYIDSAQRLDVALEYCRDKFLTPVWEQAREIMADVRKATSVASIALGHSDPPIAAHTDPRIAGQSDPLIAAHADPPIVGHRGPAFLNGGCLLPYAILPTF